MRDEAGFRDRVLSRQQRRSMEVPVASTMPAMQDFNERSTMFAQVFLRAACRRFVARIKIRKEGKTEAKVAVTAPQKPA